MNISGMYYEKQRNKKQYWTCLQGQKTEYFIDFLEKKIHTRKKKGTEKNIRQPTSSFIQLFFLFLNHLFKKNIDLMQQEKKE